jgi:hypothetical protein
MTEFEKEMAKEKELSTDLFAIMHLLTAPDWEDQEKREALSSALVGYETKYGRDLIGALEQGLYNAVDVVTEQILDGDYEDV